VTGLAIVLAVVTAGALGLAAYAMWTVREVSRQRDDAVTTSTRSWRDASESIEYALTVVAQSTAVRLRVVQTVNRAYLDALADGTLTWECRAAVQDRLRALADEVSAIAGGGPVPAPVASAEEPTPLHDELAGRHSTS
jgi:hypothetical protein